MHVSFAARCGQSNLPRAAAAADVRAWLARGDIETVRIGWCDWQGQLRGKSLMPAAAAAALDDGVGMVSTLLLKDTSDRTAYPVFEPGALAELSGFGMANNLLLLPDPASFRRLPWASGTAWMLAQPWWADGTPVVIDTRRALQQAVAALAESGYGLRCGLEVEFHIYRIDERDDGWRDPQLSAWPAEPPRVQLIHPGYHLLAESHADMADEALAIVRRTALALGLPLRSLEIELGPSQVEAVFDATDALQAADWMVLFRNGVKQALQRAGYHASFVCRPPFANVMASGWHLHHSLVRNADGGNAFMREAAAKLPPTSDPQHVLSPFGEAWLGGLLAHARGMTSFCTSTVNGYGRFRPNAMAPMAAQWARDNRGAMLRVLGQAGDADTRIENRLGEPMANPYLCIAAHIHAGLDGLRQRLPAGPATESPYAGDAPALPVTLGAAIDALHADRLLCEAFGAELVACWTRIKRNEQARFDAASDKEQWQRREYFSRY